MAGALRPALRGIIEGTPGLPPTAAGDCAAWIVGLLLEKSQALARGNDFQREAALELQRLFNTFSRDLESWFMPYLKEGFTSLGSAPLSNVDLWQ
jgi:hypothetical protein